jgi:hypothetical protein
VALRVQHQHWWFIKHLFAAPSFVMKTATFAKPKNVFGDRSNSREKLGESPT